MKIAIYHNQNCGTSRKVLARLRELGHEPEIIEYLKTPPSRSEMSGLLRKLGMRPRDILRPRGALHEELGLDDPALSDDRVLDALEAHPILMERPIVVTSKGARVCRPAERLAEIVPS
jgi:arsenate reductase